MSDDSDRSDLFGRAISLDGGLLLAGAPKKHRDVPEVQLIVSTGTASEVKYFFPTKNRQYVPVLELQKWSHTNSGRKYKDGWCTNIST